MNLMLQQDEAGDFVIGTGITHSVQELIEFAFGAVGLNWRDHVVSDLGLHQASRGRHALR